MVKGRTTTASVRRGPVATHKPPKDSGAPGIISLSGGRYCYVHVPGTGTTRHLRTDSEEFFAVLSDIEALGVGQKYRSEIEAFAAAQPRSAWVAVLARLRANDDAPAD